MTRNQKNEIALMEKIRSLHKNVSLVLKEMKPAIDSSSKSAWEPSSGFRRLIFRAILIRQYECLESIVHLVENNRGYAGVALLRPACEELIWAKYLVQLDEGDANDLLLCLTRKEMSESLKAQDDHIGRTQTKKMGLLNQLKNAIRLQPVTRTQLSCLGKKLGWEKRIIEAGIPPPSQFLAKKTGMTPPLQFPLSCQFTFCSLQSKRTFEESLGISKGDYDTI